MATATTTAQVGYVHEYAPRLMAFEFGQLSSDKVVLFIGGLGDGLLTVPYLGPLSSKLDSLGWTLVQGLISSSYSGWGTGSLARDTQEIGQLVKYLRSSKGGSRSKIILMGHSTGCQDTIEYLTKFSPEPESYIDAGILQAPVSDREALSLSAAPELLTQLNDECEELYIKKGKSHHLLPQKYSDVFFQAPISAYRWKSLLSINGDDDYFSSDLSTETLKSTFGIISKPLLVLFSANDEFVPVTVDKQKLVDRWQTVTDSKYWSKYSRLVKGATHNVGPDSQATSVNELCDTIGLFIGDL